jgi:AraC-like DNA-binding protein
MLVKSGVITIIAEGRSWVVSGSRALWIPEGVSHHISAATNVELSNLQVSRSFAPQLPRQVSTLAVSSLFRELMIAAVSGPNNVAAGTRECKILDLLFSELRITSDVALVVPDPRDIRLKRVCDALRSNPSDTRTLDQMAEAAGGCARTLARLFVKETGLTFAQWRRQVRLLAALTRLHQGQPVTSVAFDAGYDSPSAFIEMFRRVMGRTPGHYLDN